MVKILSYEEFLKENKLPIVQQIIAESDEKYFERYYLQYLRDVIARLSRGISSTLYNRSVIFEREQDGRPLDKSDALFLLKELPPLDTEQLRSWATTLALLNDASQK